jgi:uncharacterized protein YjbI with pentapeptide repeats
MPSANPSYDELERLTQYDFEAIYKRHEMFNRGQRGGIRANLKFKNLSNLDLSGRNLSFVEFTGSILAEANLSSGFFEGSSFFGCDLNNANLTNASFRRADFRGAMVAGANLHGANLESADLREGKIMERSSDGQLIARYRGGRSHDNNWKTVFTGARMADTNMTGVKAAAADFSDADMSRIIITDAELGGANFEGANLTDTDFTGSDLSHAILNSSVMCGTILDNTELTHAKQHDIFYDDDMGITLSSRGQTLKDLLENHKQWIISAGKVGKQLDLSGIDLREIGNLRKYPLTAIKAIRGNFLGQNLREINMQSAILDRSDFRDAQMTRADLRGSSLKHAMLQRADLSDAKLTSLRFDSPDGHGVRLQRMDLSGAYMRFANLSGADLRDCIMMGTDLSAANLSGADLRGADLTGAILTGAVLNGTLRGESTENPA